MQNYTTPADGINTWTSTLRYERPVYLHDNWKLAYRFELPAIYSNDGNTLPFYRGSHGDTLFQTTISNAEIDAPEISDGSYFQFIARYRFDFAGDSSRNHFSNLQFAPSVNINLPSSWYVIFFPSTDIRCNFMRREWFVPFNIEIGEALSGRCKPASNLAFQCCRETFRSTSSRRRCTSRSCFDGIAVAAARGKACVFQGFALAPATRREALAERVGVKPTILDHSTSNSLDCS